MNYSGIKYADMINGRGIRVSLFVSGCTHCCKNCFNEETWKETYGNKFTEKEEDEIIEYIKKFGFAGRSLGCPVLPNSLTREIIDFIKHGRILFIYGNDEEYVDNSAYLSKLAPVFVGSPKNIVEIEKLVEVQNTTPTTTVVATTTAPTTVVSDNKKDNTNREIVIAEANTTKIFEIIKQEYKYTNSVDNNKIAYTRLLKDVIQEKLNKTPEIKEGTENKK